MQTRDTAATTTRRPHARRGTGKLKTLALATALCAAAAAHAQEITPYFAGWTSTTLPQVQTAASHNAFTLAFGITRGSCALDSYLTNQLPGARTFVANGGLLTISMGGADGTYAEIACTDDQLFALLEKLMADAGTRRIDWDVEGAQLANTTGHARRARVLLRLQQKYPDMFVSFTLPAWLYGLDSNAMALLRTTIATGVRIDRVNAMSMSFGATNLKTMAGGSMSQAVIMAVRATHAQLATLWPSRTVAQIYAMMGVTPMIGTNDDLTTFTLADAQAVADFVKQNGVGMVSYWAFHRDREQTTAGQPLSNYSGVVQTAYQFLKTFKTASGTVATAPTTSTTTATATTTTTATTTSTSTCSATNWVRGTQYPAGAIVNYQGKQYIAKIANANRKPTSTTYWAVYVCSATAAAPAPAPAPAPAATSCAYPDWVMYQPYAAGDIVSYQGLLYRAKYANPGYNPTISTYYWEPYTCA